jgi:hypothetical protein
VESVSFAVLDDFFWCETIYKVCETHIHTNILIPTLSIPTLPPVMWAVPMMMMSVALDKAMELVRAWCCGVGCGVDALGHMMLRELI